MKEFKISLKTLRSSTALFLIVMMVISVFSILAVNGQINSSAAGVDKNATAGSNSDQCFMQDYLYVDMSGAGGASLSGVNTYFSRSDQSDFPTNNWITSKTSMGSNVYRFTLKGTDASYQYFRSFKVVTDSGTCYMSVVSNSDWNCINMTSATSANWKTYTETGGDAPGNFVYEYDATEGNSMENSEIAYKADMTLYDYLDDKEYTDGWGNVKVAGNSATWYPFGTLNSKLSSYYESNGVRTPLYFGNFNTGQKTESNRHTDYDNAKKDLYKFKPAANNSKAAYYHGKYNDNLVGLSGYDFAQWSDLSNDADYSYSYQGIVSKDLDSNGKLQMVSGSGGNYTSTAAPFFNDTFLENEKIGKRVNTVLPFAYDSSSEKYTYMASTASTHENPINNIYLSSKKEGDTDVANNLAYADKNGLIMHYGGNQKGIRDGRKWFGFNGEGGYGFFPFNNATISHTDGDVRNDLDYGLGMSLEIPFTLPENKKTTSNNDIIFSFTGDDDVWVYIDGKLVVDLGGDHKDSHGEINFTKGTVTYGKDGSGADAVDTNDMPGKAGTAYSVVDALDSNKDIHTLSMFYMERGLIESNMQVEFTFTPLKNTLTVDKTVDAADVMKDLNDSTKKSTIQTAVEKADNFRFDVKTGTSSSDCNTVASGKNYSKNGSTDGSTDSNGSFKLKNEENVLFNGTFEASTSNTDTKYISVDENKTATDKPKLTYDTKWSLEDPDTSTIIDSKDYTDNSTKSTFEFINSEKDYSRKTNLQLSYTNKVKTKNLVVKKEVYRMDGSTKTKIDTYDSQKFSFDLYLDWNLDGNVDENSEYVATYRNLSVNNPVTITGIPVGMKYKVKEQNNVNGFTPVEEDVTDVFTGTMGNSDATVTMENKVETASVKLAVEKTVDNIKYTGEDFTFTLKPLVQSGSTYTPGAVIDTQSKVNNGDVVSFKSISLDTPGTKYYIITEDYNEGHSNDYQIDGNVVIAKVVYALGTTPVVSYSVYEGVTDYSTMINNFTSADPVFNNSSSDLQLNLTKSKRLDGSGNPVDPIKGAEFAIYKVDNTGDTNLTDTNKIKTAKTDLNGKLTFGNLDIFEDGSITDYQVYAVKETKAPNGFVLSTQIKYFTLGGTSSNDVIVPTYNNTNDMYVANVGFIDGVITIPFTGIQVDSTYFTIGCGVILLGILLGAYYIFRSRRKKLAYVSRHSKR